MTIEREIVLMLIHRKRLAKRCLDRFLCELKPDSPESTHVHSSYLEGQFIEASNAAESARRLLYGYAD